MDRIDFSNLGGMPVTQYSLLFMQTACRDAFSGIARLAGNKSIIAGVEVTSGNVSNGWISYNNELIPFIGGALGNDVVITETPEPRTYQDGTEHPVYFKKVARCGAVGDFPFSDLVRLQSLQNIWLPGDIKEKYVDNAYIAANFDADGYGINKEKGWRILSKAYPPAAGKVSVNLDPTDPDFNECGKTGGAKTHTLTIGEMPAHTHTVNGDGENDTRRSGSNSQQIHRQFGTKQSGSAGSNQPHNNLQPYFVTLKLIKL